MNIKPGLQRTLALAGAISISSTALADEACRTTEDSLHSVLHLDGFTHSASGKLSYSIGNFDFFGASVVGACVADAGTGTSTLYVILDQANHLLGWLPKTFNQLCLTSSVDETQVLQQDLTACGVTMHPLNYNGNTFVQYGQGSSDILRGGNGIDILYGGVGNDTITDYVSVGMTGNYYGELYGESGDDRLWGSPGDSTLLNGGPGNDGLWDLGGNTDVLYGGDGNECCVYDSNDTFSGFDCGNGSDHVRTSTGNFPKTGCEVVDATCTPTIVPGQGCF